MLDSRTNAEDYGEAVSFDGNAKANFKPGRAAVGGDWCLR